VEHFKQTHYRDLRTWRAVTATKGVSAVVVHFRFISDSVESMRSIFKFVGGLLVLLTDGVIQGLNHWQALDFLKEKSPEIYAFIIGTPFSAVLFLIAVGFIVRGCIGIRVLARSSSLKGLRMNCVIRSPTWRACYA
jgi:hypothetical protein